MQVKNPELFQKLEVLADHYQHNVASNHLKAEFSSLSLARRDWDEIELITARQEVFRQQGYHLDELYLKLLSLARLVHQARIHLVPHIKSLVSHRYATKGSNDRLMAEMAAANFGANLTVLATQILDVFHLAKREDADQNQGRNKALASVPEAAEIEALLKG
jgi:hypothetical protein